MVSGIQDETMLSGTVQLDETYYCVRAGDVERKTDGLKYRGTSRNQYCIGVACDDEKFFFKVEGLGSPSIRTTVETLGQHIQPGFHLVHDFGKTHSALVKLLNLTEDVYDACELKRLNDKDNPPRQNQSNLQSIKEVPECSFWFSQG